jgi:hypothetical protein
MPTFLRFLLKSLHGGKERKRELLRSGWSVKDGFYSTQLIDATSYKYTNPNKPKCTESFQKSNSPCLQP